MSTFPKTKFLQGHRSRMREKFLNIPAKNFQDYEILEMLLFMANPRSDTKTIAKDLLAQMQNFENIINNGSNGYDQFFFSDWFYKIELDS